MPKKLIIILFSIKIITLLIFCDFSVMNYDEETCYEIANNFLNGKNYGLFNMEGKYVLSSFHNNGMVLFYQKMIENNFPKQIWIYIYYFVSHVFFLLSLISFYKICIEFMHNKKARIAMAVYALYPSILLFIGTGFYLENLSTYLLIIIIYQLIKWKVSKTISILKIIIAAILVAISCYIRNQMIFIYFILFSVVFIIYIKKRIKIYKFLFFISILIMMVSVIFYPILLKNKKQFDEYILSTQSGFEFLQGHNPTARGSWMSGGWEKNNPLYKYSHENIKGLDSMNELEASNARKTLAFEWVKNHPIDDIKLEFRKIAIYFLPKNFEGFRYRTFNIYNPINLLIHIGFISFLIILMLNFRRLFSTSILIILLPIIASIAISLIFFVGYRWRIYAEPFMIICTFILLQWYTDWKHKKIQSSTVI